MPLALLAPGLGLAERRGLLLGVFVVCGDDPLDELVPHHVLAAEADELDALDLLEDLVEAAVHGVLHLCGYDHETDAGEMLKLQDRVMAELR